MADANLVPIRNRAGAQTGWRVRWRDEKGARPGKSFGLDEKPLAERFMSEIRQAQSSSPRKPRSKPRRKTGTLKEFFETAYGSKINMSRKKSAKGQLSSSAKSTRESVWTKWICPTLGERPIRSITSEELDEFFKSITHYGRDEDGRFPIDATTGEQIRPHASWTNGHATAQKCKMLLSDIFDYACRNGVVNTNPVPKSVIELPIDDDDERMPEKWPEDSEVAAIVSSSTGSLNVLVRVLATLGLRIGEALSLHVSDFDEKREQLVVQRSMSTKPKRHQGGKGMKFVAPKTEAGLRKINLPSDLASALREICLDRQPNAPLFPSKRGKFLRPDNFRSREWRSLLERAGVRSDITPHDLRHYTASRLISDGIDELQVSKMLGHANPGITHKIYAHARVERSREIASYWERPENRIA